MTFLLADTFTSSLARLTADEQKSAKISVFDLQSDPAGKGHSFHRIDRAKDKRFWSVRASSDIRIIVHKTESSFLVCYVDHHDDAYDWAMRRKIETHPKTGAAQIVEIVERHEEVIIPIYREVEIEVPVEVHISVPAKSYPLAQFTSDFLIQYGVPGEWTERLIQADEDTLLEFAEHLPEEAAEAVLQLATSGIVVPPALPPSMPVLPDPFEHPDAKRRFRVIRTAEDLEQALEYPWDKWLQYLHPSQSELVDREFNGPARVSGTAGTGKTVVALHRAVRLLRENPDARVLLCTIEPALADLLSGSIRKLIHTEPTLGERIDIESLDRWIARLHQSRFGRTSLIEAPELRSRMPAVEPFVATFVWEEFQRVVEAWGLRTWEAYRDIKRTGRRTRLTESQRQTLWTAFEKLRSELRNEGRITRPEMAQQLIEAFQAGAASPYAHILVDESQDIPLYAMRLLAAMNGNKPDGLFFSGDLGQRIFQSAYSWREAGVDIRGRSHTLSVNYRTGRRIRIKADQLLGHDIADLDGFVESRTGVVSPVDGHPPEIRLYGSSEEEMEGVSSWLQARLEEGVANSEIGIFVRSENEIERALEAVRNAGARATVIDRERTTVSDTISLGTMHVAKGLEFRVVVVMACDDGVIPMERRLTEAEDESALEDIYLTERYLLYVACTRARERLLVCGVTPGSEFLQDLG